MDRLDNRLVEALRRNGRLSISDLATLLGVTRSTVRARLARLESAGDILGYTVVTKGDRHQMPVRGMMMLAIEGRGTDRIVARLQGMPEVEAINTTNGSWDLIVQLGTETLEQLDRVLLTIRRIDGISRSETNLMLGSRPVSRPRGI